MAGAHTGVSRAYIIAVPFAGQVDPVVVGEDAQVDERVGALKFAQVRQQPTDREGADGTDRQHLARPNLAEALVLRRVDFGQESLGRFIPFGAAQLVAHSPVSEQQVSRGGMTIGAMCEATITTSDNTAANLILARYGGPAGLTAFLRSIGDAVTRLDRFEPAMNAGAPGDPRDTTSPRAMLRSMQRVVLGDVLTASSRALIQQWMQANTTGATRLRAGIPPGWRVGDKTGTGDAGTTNDIGVVWPNGQAPLLVTAYLGGGTASDAALNHAIAEVGAVLASIARG